MTEVERLRKELEEAQMFASAVDEGAAQWEDDAKRYRQERDALKVEREAWRAEQVAIHAALDRLEPALERTGRPSDDLISLVEFARKRAEKADAQLATSDRLRRREAQERTELHDRCQEAEGETVVMRAALLQIVHWRGGKDCPEYMQTMPWRIAMKVLASDAGKAAAEVIKAARGISRDHAENDRIRNDDPCCCEVCEAVAKLRNPADSPATKADKEEKP